MNLSALWSLPVLFVVENNGIAQSTPTAAAVAGSLLARGQAFGIGSSRVGDTSENFLEDVEAIVDGVRTSNRPHFLVIDTERLGAHSKGDDLRPREEIDRIRARDPLLALRARLPEDAAQAAEHQNQTFIRECSASVLARVPARRVQTGGRAAQGLSPLKAKNITVRESLNTALRRLLSDDPKIILLGEDLHDPYGGAFKVTAGLSASFPGRVLSTPISEAAITGSATGLALAGFKPVAEIMFADFLGLCIDQILNHAAKLAPIKGSEAPSLVIRTPSGGRRGYGPTHSQSPEGLLASIPGLTVIAVHHRIEPGILLQNAIQSCAGPVLFFEHKLLYSQTVNTDGYRPLPSCLSSGLDTLFPTMGRLENEADVIILTYGGMLIEAEAAARSLYEEEELAVEILVPSLIAPFPAEAIIERVETLPPAHHRRRGTQNLRRRRRNDRPDLGGGDQAIDPPCRCRRRHHSGRPASRAPGAPRFRRNRLRGLIPIR